MRCSTERSVVAGLDMDDETPVDGADWNGWGAAIIASFEKRKSRKKGETENMGKSQKVAAEKEKIQTPEFRASFPALFEPRSAKQGDKAYYSITMYFRVTETAKSKELGEKIVTIDALKNAVRMVAEQKFGTDRSKWPKLKLPFRSILTEEDKDKKGRPGLDEGVIWVEAKSDPTNNPRPGVVHSHAGQDGRPAPLTVPSDFYGGCYARATINPYHWEYMGKQGISFGLQNVQKLRDGEPLGGRGSAENDFDAVDAPAGGAQPVGAGATASADPLGL